MYQELSMCTFGYNNANLTIQLIESLEKIYNLVFIFLHNYPSNSFNNKEKLKSFLFALNFIFFLIFLISSILSI